MYSYQYGLCPEPLIFVTDQMSKSTYYYMVVTKCALPCPHSFWPDKKMNDLYIMQTVFNSFSLVSAILLIILFGLLPKEITAKMEIIFSFAICSIFLSLSYFMANSQDKYCGENQGWMVEKDALCGVNGAFFQFGTLGIIFWWTYMCYDFYMSIRNVKKPWPFVYHRVLIWFAAIFFCVLPLAANQIIASPKSTGCWMHKSSTWQLACFHIPSWICLIFIIYSTIYSIYKVYTIYKITESTKVLYYNVKQVLIMCIVLFNFVFVVLYTFVSIGKNNIYNKTLHGWVHCLAIDGEDSCELDMPDFIIRFLVAIAITDNGLLGFLAYGLEANNLKVIRRSTVYIFLATAIRNSPLTISSSSSSTTDSNKQMLNNNNSDGIVDNKFGVHTPSNSAGSLEIALEDQSTQGNSETTESNTNSHAQPHS
ncbi:hypothetical protein SAMD00019534_078560 [Acytostelium subglobosum LB1]|uniref:hypothetical protein n=1 Tax=Acytostelium subglobosum LB1 TaxID=1410327 RepID=UPI000644FC39|nr:hypothetical protein SAMD00019534_078560 [Acytostelium subglobosum LB1]GAM24681.1 hypothetical protein SAMD00019534_078560 [Acytostelium subglobosum LB1]|eukprot:XP_012752350.1 hypothetical protein SAMD00019534_078560 [Acytostelium subglobosum LB1]